jgi:hypothetical protein
MFIWHGEIPFLQVAFGFEDLKSRDLKNKF